MTLRAQENDEAWLKRVKSRSEEIFCRKTQELLLEKEHLFTFIRRLLARMVPKQLD